MRQNAASALDKPGHRWNRQRPTIKKWYRELPAKIGRIPKFNRLGAGNLDNATNNLDMVKQQQALAVANAHSVLLNAGIVATPSPVNLAGANPAISGTYTGTDEGQYVIIYTKVQTAVCIIPSAAWNHLREHKFPITAPAFLYRLVSHGLYLQSPLPIIGRATAGQLIFPTQKLQIIFPVTIQYQSAINPDTGHHQCPSKASPPHNKPSTGQRFFALKAAPALPADVATAQAQLITRKPACRQLYTIITTRY